MVFSSTLFLFLFLPLTLIVYYLIPKALKNYWLLFVSLVFFAWNQVHYLWLILLSILVNYTGALIMDRYQAGKSRLVWLWITLAVNLGLLGYFKYFNFVADNLQALLHTDLHLESVILPIGISFFTFQSMSYVIDVYSAMRRSRKIPFLWRSTLSCSRS